MGRGEQESSQRTDAVCVGRVTKGIRSLPGGVGECCFKVLASLVFPVDPPEGPVLPLLRGGAGFREKVSGLFEDPSQRSYRCC